MIHNIDTLSQYNAGKILLDPQKYPVVTRVHSKNWKKRQAFYTQNLFPFSLWTKTKKYVFQRTQKKSFLKKP